MTFFGAKQVQEVISTEYPDRAWDINTDGEKYMKADILSAVEGKESFSVGFRIGYSFLRDLPTDAPISSGESIKKFDFGQYLDCLTGQQLREFSAFDCSKKPKKDYLIIHIHNSYSNELILGPTKSTKQLMRKKLPHDM